MPLIRQLQRPFQEHEFSVYRRYICLHKYPEPKNGRYLHVGEIAEFRNEDICIGEDNFIESPLFKKLEWYENRTFEQLFSIRYIQVSVYSSYYVVGDILEVDSFEMDLRTLTPKLIGFKCGSQIIKLNNCLPLESYQDYKYRNVAKLFQKN